MARLSRETTLSPDYISGQLTSLSGEITTIQTRILDMIADPSIVIDADDMGALADNVSTIRDVSDSLHRLLGALSARLSAAPKATKASKPSDKAA